MCSAQVSETDRAAGVAARPNWWLVEVNPLAEFCLRVRFLDGLTGNVDMDGLVNSIEAGIFSTLRDVEVFQNVRIEHGVATWPGDVDLAPDAMHAAIAKSGRWILTA